MLKIKQLYARSILDSRGLPTIETMIVLDNEGYVVASVPSGASTGIYEAVDLRDGDMNAYLGLGVSRAVRGILETIGPKLVGLDPTNQSQIDSILRTCDPTENKSNLGANALLAVSMVVCKAGAYANQVPLYRYINTLSQLPALTRLPTPIFNFVNGGLHGMGNLDFQEFHLIPATNKTFPESLKIGVESYQHLKKILAKKGAIYSVGDEGGFTPTLFGNIDVFELILEAAREAGYAPGRDVFLGLDAAADTFFKETKYMIKDRTSPLSGQELIDIYSGILDQYRLIFIEDGLNETDFDGWVSMTAQLGFKTVIVGDNLLATNKSRLQSAIDRKAVTGIMIEPNQIGTITETLETVRLARNHNITTITANRSGETNDSFIADFSVGVSDLYCKFGAPCRGERVAKYNRLLQIYDELIESH